MSPPPSWAYLDGEELVVRGSGGSGEGVRVQIARARLRQWTPRTEARFLATPAVTCNVKAACAEAGLSVPSAYRHRDRWSRFAKRWDDAVAAGCAALKAALLEAGANIFSASEAAPREAGEHSPPAIAAMDAHQALHLLYMHKHYVPRAGRMPGRRPTAASPGETAGGDRARAGAAGAPEEAAGGAAPAVRAALLP